MSTSLDDVPLLVLDGHLPSRDLLRRLREGRPLLVAADGAALRLRMMGLIPDVIVGDLDAAGDSLEHPDFARAIVVEDRDQDDYDVGKCLSWLSASGFDAVTVVGYGGGMTDHLLNNFSVFARHASRIRIDLREDGTRGRIIVDAADFETRPGERVSLIPLPAARITTQGLAWELRNEWLRFGLREGASNRAIARQISISVAEGTLALFHFPR